jgi:hypothetical protein
MPDDNAFPGPASSGDTPPVPPGGAYQPGLPPPRQISLEPTSRPQLRGARRPPESGKAADEPKDNFREVVETIVFVVVLVLLLKTFLAEAFVIPTGSMATTLLGYHYQVTCTECDYPFPVNASTEADPQDGGGGRPVFSCTCPNCGAVNVLRQSFAPGGPLP